MGVRNLAVVLTGDGTSLGGTLRRASAEVDTFARNTEAKGTRVASSWKAVGSAFAAGGIVVALGLGAAGVAAAGFETRMRNVNSIAALSESELRSLGGSVLDLSRQLPQSANTLAEGLYDIASSGFAGADGLKVLRASAEAASAGLTTTEVSARGIAAVLNAYGRSADDASDVSDVLFQTVNLGVVSFEELAGNIGDVVGMAAAAKSPIEDVGAAIAAMTLTGISGAEATTSLNRVYQSIIQPSKQLAAALSNLGFESGAQALEVDGLQTVMDKLRVSTGGNITALLELFPEIRAARGALALMSDEGRTYARVADQITDVDRRQGATKRALDEQLKATSAQLRIIGNRATATAIELGSHLLPAFQDLLKVTADVGSDALPVLVGGFHAAEPLLRALWQVGVDVVDVLQEMATVVGPVVEALATIGGGAILGALTLLAHTLAGISGFVADNEGAVRALTAILLGGFLVAMTGSAFRVAAFNVQVARAIIATGTFNGTLLSLRLGAGLAASQLGAVATSMFAVQAVATVGVGAAVLAWSSYVGVQRKVQGAVDDTADAIDKGTLPALDDQRAALLKTRAELERTIKTYTDASFIARFWKTYSGGASAAVAAAKGLDQVDAALHRVDVSSFKAKSNLYRVLQSRMTPEALDKLMHDGPAFTAEMQRIGNQAGELGINVSGSYKQFTKLGDALRTETGLTASQLKTNFAGTSAALEALGKALDDVQKSANDAFAGASDIFGAFDPSKAAEDVASATERVHSAEQALSDTRARQTGKTTASDEVSLASARRDVADATKDLSTAQAAVGAADLSGTYRDIIRQGEAFTSNLQEATRRGLDPQFVQRLLQQGPEAAAPVLEALVSGSGNRMVELANKSERQLRRINRVVVEFARLTQLAVSAETDTLATDLDTAMAIASEKVAEGSKATAESVGKAIGVPTKRVLRIAEEFGIILGQAVQRGLDSRPPTVRVPVAAGKLHQLEKGMAGGGVITGPWRGPAADNVLVRANPREYILPVAAVDHYGLDWLERVRTRALPRFAGGGLIGSSTAAAGARSEVLRVPLVERREFNQPVIIERLEGLRLDDVEEEAERRRDFASSPGWSD